MKLSLAWLFDHIDADYKTIAITDLVNRFNTTTAEIEHVTHVELNLNPYSLVTVTGMNADITVKSDEWQREFALPLRPDAKIGTCYLVKRTVTDEGQNYSWAKVQEWHSSKEGLMPAFLCAENIRAGAWKRTFEVDDYILELDNKSITHRPDLWGHRGVAREIAALFDFKLKPEAGFVAPLEVRLYDSAVSATPASPISITVSDTTICKRFSGLYIDAVVPQASSLWMAYRLARVDNRPINALVDATNYVMLDIGQPMHAYDADSMSTKHVAPRYARTGQTLALLDGQTIKLTNDDVVVTDGNNPICLAGIMGGFSTALSDKTTRMFVEAACWNAGTIRRTAMHHKLRTEASARVEKSLDPEQTIVALKRFVRVLQDMQIPMNVAPTIASVGIQPSTIVITVMHNAIEQSLGTQVTPERVVMILEKLDFGVQRVDGGYAVTVPSFRASKDVSIKQDIIEEIGRYVGYASIEPVLPDKKTTPFDMHGVQQIRALRAHAAYALAMRELYNYSLYDEQFLRELNWEPTKAVDVKNPVSEHWRRLVTSLIPHLIRAIAHNSADNDQLRFIEWGRTWTQNNEIIEHKVFAGIVFDKKNTVDFYSAKENVQSLCTIAGMTHVLWRRVDTPEQPWFLPHQTADIIHNGTVIGRTGKINPLFLHTVTEGDAFIFECDATYFRDYQAPVHHYIPASKYPDVVRDISMLMPRARTADEVAAAIAAAHPTIVDVTLVDFFHKSEWGDRTSLTFRFVLRDTEKTLTKPEVDAVVHYVTQALEELGAEIR